MEQLEETCPRCGSFMQLVGENFRLHPEGGLLVYDQFICPRCDKEPFEPELLAA